MRISSLRAPQLTSAKKGWEPPKYFAFSSEPLPAARVRDLVAQHGKNILIGVDPTYEGADETVQAALQAGTRLHVYLEGPGGPTGDNGEWDPGEFARIKNAAKKYGIIIKSTSDSDPGMKQWNDWGWKRHAKSQLQDYRQKGFESAELDNLYRGLGESPARLVAFFREAAGWEGIPRILLKNVDLPQMQALERAEMRDTFADFHIWETSAGPLNGQEKVAQRMGIRTLLSRDTYHYSAEGPYRN